MCHLDQVFGDSKGFDMSFAERIWRSSMIRIRKLKIYLISLKKKLQEPTIKESTKNVDTVNTPLKPGDMVRVRSLGEIKQTLDEEGNYKGGMPFIDEMAKHCGGKYRVYKRVNKIFDSREWKMKKTRDLVVLEGVFCDGYGPYIGCDRSCFFFWKEAWLERI